MSHFSHSVKKKKRHFLFSGLWFSPQCLCGNLKLKKVFIMQHSTLLQKNTNQITNIQNSHFTSNMHSPAPPPFQPAKKKPQTNPFLHSATKSQCTEVLIGAHTYTAKLFKRNHSGFLHSALKHICGTPQKRVDLYLPLQHECKEHRCQSTS